MLGLRRTTKLLSMSDSVYTLSWPRSLFLWEAKRILKTSSNTELREWTEHLLREAFEDERILPDYAAKVQAADTVDPWGIPSPKPPTADPIRQWLTSITADETKLKPYKQPVYYAERHSSDLAETGSDTRFSFMEDFMELIQAMAKVGYFPNILPKVCADDHWAEDINVTKELRRATKLAIDWPLSAVEAKMLPDAAVYSLVEYFHDQAQRPRAAKWHHWNDCGYDYSAFNRESGGTVYRWRVNELLEDHNAPLRLGNFGDEQGRLIHHFSAAQDELLSVEIENRSDRPSDEVAHAIRMFRARGANNIDKRAALAILAGRLELKRDYLVKKTTKGDVDDIFHIANRYNIRHRKDQISEEREEYLEWMFWNFLSMVRLLDALEMKQQASVGVGS